MPDPITPMMWHDHSSTMGSILYRNGKRIGRVYSDGSWIVYIDEGVDVTSDGREDSPAAAKLAVEKAWEERRR